MKLLLCVVLAASAFAASADPKSPIMLSGPWVPADPQQLDFAALPRVPSEHVIINDVHAKGSLSATLDKKAGGVNQHNYLAHHDGQFWAMWSDGPGIEDRVSRTGLASA